ncbi:MAG TPA: hypothetical protein VMT62_05630 [Syntrophorhabdaceae bacterium]|nr:hypothetical protein [Syntrophorhabdaceae bacterium]
MRFFAAIDFHHLVLALFLGVAGAIVLYLSFRYGTDFKSGEEIDPTEGGHMEKTRGGNYIPPVLVFLYAAVVLSIILYVVSYFAVFKARPI